jgi:reticulon-4-interacting protein 1, mitochondrial
MRSGYGRSIFRPLLPLIIGRDISGEVAATGTSASSFSIGQEVFGALHPTALRGTYADYAILSLDELTPKPSTLSHAVGVIKFIYPFPSSNIIRNAMLGSILFGEEER